MPRARRSAPRPSRVDGLGASARQCRELDSFGVQIRWTIPEGGRMAGSEQPLDSLEKVEHIVVLMLENRSFDHMLGYLSLERGREDVDGLKPEMSNNARGTSYAVKHLDATHIPNPHWDPDHSAAATDLQIGGGEMDGFAESFARTLESRKVTEPPPDPGKVMGYYHAGDLPVTEDRSARLVRLPFYCGISAAEQMEVVSRVEGFMAQRCGHLAAA